MIGYTFGLHVTGPGAFDVYEEGVYLASYTHPVKTGTWVGLAARNATATVERFEAWTAPGGTLVWADDFASLAAWTDAFDGAGWSASGGKAVANPAFNDLSMVLVRPRLTASYFVADGIDFSGGDSVDRWVMIDAFRGVSGRSDDPADAAWKGYRLFVRDNPPPGGGVPGATWDLSTPNGTLSGVTPPSTGGWSAGVIR